ncbi:unnamed protein product [Rangifer tarandus platyrhynchus]|uniref:Uncharacterized protein n=2 Tax=Rangifer tarandus platyrhynchus TaxID=3082113 RepID=A0ACB0E4J9_RANTA|nr:unnamed protein product [Rangifer tarandus platyrhynchus]CAI9695450.1 unnamed protein product [Rangifer tarandus platyrhynchus]
MVTMLRSLLENVGNAQQTHIYERGSCPCGPLPAGAKAGRSFCPDELIPAAPTRAQTSPTFLRQEGDTKTLACQLRQRGCSCSELPLPVFCIHSTAWLEALWRVRAAQSLPIPRETAGSGSTLPPVGSHIRFARADSGSTTARRTQVLLAFSTWKPLPLQLVGSGPDQAPGLCQQTRSSASGLGGGGPLGWTLPGQSTPKGTGLPLALQGTQPGPGARLPPRRLGCGRTWLPGGPSAGRPSWSRPACLRGAR